MSALFFIPPHLPAALEFKSRYPEAQFISGGLSFLSSPSLLPHIPLSFEDSIKEKGSLFSLNDSMLPSEKPFSAQKRFIVLTSLKELKKLHIEKEYIEMGASLPLSTFLHLSLFSSLEAILPFIAPAPLLHLITLGGNLSQKHCQDLFFPLLALGARIELRSLSRTLFLSFKEFYDFPLKDFLITRIFMPLKNWKKMYYVISPSHPSLFSSTRIAFCALIDIQKNSISETRIFFSFGRHGILELRELENNLKGKTLLLSESLISHLIENFYEQTLKKNKTLEQKEVMIAIQFLTGFFEELNLLSL